VRVHSDEAKAMTTFTNALTQLIDRGGPIYADPTDDVMALIQERRLVGQPELARYCGVSTMTVKNWCRSNRNPLPEPSYRIGAGPAWWLDELETWMRDNVQLLGEGSDAAAEQLSTGTQPRP
jgi:DNA-binding transcriptional regulator YiaG